jgi:hypothetical protein
MPRVVPFPVEVELVFVELLLPIVIVTVVVSETAVETTVVVEVDVTVVGDVVKVTVTVVVLADRTCNVPIPGALAGDCTTQSTIEPTGSPANVMESPNVVSLTPFTTTDHSAPAGSPDSTNVTMPIRGANFAVSVTGPFMAMGAAGSAPL